MRWTCKRSAARSRTSATAGSSRRGSGLMCTLELCATQKEFGTSNARTSMHAPATTNSTGPIPMDLSSRTRMLRAHRTACMRTSSRSSPQRIHHGLIRSPQIHNGRGPDPVPVHQAPQRMHQRHSVNTAFWRQRSTPCRGASSETQCTLDRGAKLWAYLDDLYIWTKTHLALGATRTINVELQPSKMQIWTASYTSPVPPAFLSKAKRTLKCFGSPSPHGQ